MNNNKIERIKDYCKNKGYQGMLIFNDLNIRYITDVETSGCLFIGDDVFLIVPLLHYDLVSEKIPKTISYFPIKIKNDPLIYEGSFYETIKHNLEKRGIKKVLIDQTAVKESKIKVSCKSSKKIEKMRMIKTGDETEKIKKAIRIAKSIVSKLDYTEKTDRQAIAQLVYDARIHADDVAYTPIVASGTNTRYPHPSILDQKVDKDPLLIDFGIKYQGYCSDITTTKSCDRKINEIIENLESLILNIVDKIEIGMDFKELDTFAREYLKRNNYSSYFIHSLGHGIGLNVHERPFISQESKDTIENEMIFTLEPGLYFEDFGVRIEKMIRVFNNKAQIISD